ncbi:hypothetical protein [Flavobacterium psychrotrophum]|uniref:hypothetical protein n=1 Tax=Flavobacterium psychrotrophum TaxID=2294119 RepID=UPI0013C52B79|nr:hypothetical protein [Flavobacterium psychrotrophum]
MIFLNSGFRQDYTIVFFSIICIILYLLFVTAPWFYSRVLGILHHDAAQQSHDLSMDVFANAFVKALLLSSVVSNAISFIAYFVYPSNYYVAVPDKFNTYIILSVAEFFILGSLYYMVNKYPVKINFSHTTLYSVIKLLMKILGFYVIINHVNSYFYILLDNPKEYLKHLVEITVIAAILLNPDWLLRLLRLSHQDINKRQLLAVSIRFFALVIIISYLLPGLYYGTSYLTNNISLYILLVPYAIIALLAIKISQLFPKLE